MKNIATNARKISATAIFCTIFWSWGAVQAQPAAHPSRPIRIVVPFTPGGSTDMLARAIGQELTRAWGQRVVVDNLPALKSRLTAEGAVATPSTPRRLAS